MKLAIVTKTGGSFILTNAFIVGSYYQGTNAQGREILIHDDDVESIRNV